MAKRGRPPKRDEGEIEALGAEMVEWFADPNQLWLKDFCILKRFPSENLSRWAQSNEAFAQALKICKDIQESRLFHAGLKKDINPTMAVFALKNVAKWRSEPEESVGDSELHGLARLLGGALVSAAGAGRGSRRDSEVQA